MVPFGFAIVLAGLAVVGRATAANWLAPVAFWPLVWAVLMGAAGLLQDVLPLQPQALWVIVSMLVAFQVGALVVHYAQRSPTDTPGPYLDGATLNTVARRLGRVTAFLSVLSATGVALLMFTGAAGAGIELSLVGLLRLGNLLSIMRYTGVEDVPGLVRVFLYWTFSAALLGGMLAAVAETLPRRLLSVLPLFLAVAGGIVVASRSGFLLSGVMWVAGFWAVRVCTSGGTYDVFRVKWIAGITVTVVGLIGLSVALLWLRAGIWRRLVVEVFVTTTVGDFFGSVSAFSTWLAVGDPVSPALGAFTFAGPFDFFGLAPRLQGIYGTAVTFPSGLTSNIYTLFRGLIQDFGLAGAWGACLVGGAVSTIAYRQCVAGRVQWVVPLSLAYTLMLFSHLYSVFTHNSVVLGWLSAALVWLWPTRIWSTATGPEHLVGRQLEGPA